MAMTDKKRKSDVPTPYATICEGDSSIGWRGCGQQFMTEEYYTFQLSSPNATWRCPSCGMEAQWDDDNYEKYMDVEDENANHN